MTHIINYEEFKRKLCFSWLPQLYYPPCKIHEVLQRIALKYFPIIPIRKIHQCQNMEDVLRLLEKWKLLAYDRLTIIIELSDLLQGPTSTIKEELLKLNPECGSVSFCICYEDNFIESNLRTRQNLEHRSNGLIHHESVYTEVFNYLSENIGLRWIDLGRRLPGMRNRTEELKNDFSLRQKDKIITLLEEFGAKCEDNVVIQLLYFLNLCKMKRQSDEIRGKFGYLL